MKRLLLILTIIAMAACMCSCDLKTFTGTLTVTEPQEVTEDFFRAIKGKDEDVLILYTENEDINMLLHSKGDEKQLSKMYENLFKNYTYKIVSVKKNKGETKAVAEVEVSNSDFSKVLKKYQDKAYEYMQSNLYNNISKKKLNAKCLELFVDQVEKAAGSDQVKTTTLKVDLTKNDDYSWDMELTEEMMETIMGGLIIPL